MRIFNYAFQAYGMYQKIDTLTTNDMRISWLIVDGRILERVIESIRLGRQADELTCHLSKIRKSTSLLSHFLIYGCSIYVPIHV